MQGQTAKINIFQSDSLPFFSPSVDASLLPGDAAYSVFPGFCDVHVHFREPGFSYKETIASGSAAAAHGGYTAVCTMPNLAPVPDSLPHLEQQLEIIEKTAAIAVHPYGSISVGEQGKEIADLEAMAPYVCAFSDDGKGVQDSGLMKEAMTWAKALGKLVVAHCEVNELLRGGYIHDGRYAKAHGHKGICSESEWKMIERDLKLAVETGCAYHVCHISTKESVEIIRNAKRRGINVTCETAPHYLVLCEDDLQEDGRYKMNPPLRSAEDRDALLQGLLDGTIDMIATDHAPHSAEEKSKGLAGSAFGIIGLETAFPVLYTHLVKPGIAPLQLIVEKLTQAPRKRFALPDKNSFSVWSLATSWTVREDRLLSKGKSTPFMHQELYGECLLTVNDGKIVYLKA